MLGNSPAGPLSGTVTMGTGVDSDICQLPGEAASSGLEGTLRLEAGADSPFGHKEARWGLIITRNILRVDPGA